MSDMCTSEFDGTYWWVVIPDHLWEERETTDWINGIPILWKNKVHKV